MKHLLTWFPAAGLILLAVACAAGPASAPSLAAPAATATALPTAPPVEPAAQAILAYLQARVDGDANRIVALSCAAWEAQARIEVASFKNVKPRLENVQCRVSTAGAAEAQVACQGSIATSYNGERRDFDVSHRLYLAVNDGGEWRMCGYR